MNDRIIEATAEVIHGNDPKSTRFLKKPTTIAWRDGWGVGFKEGLKEGKRRERRQSQLARQLVEEAVPALNDRREAHESWLKRASKLLRRAL